MNKDLLTEILDSVTAVHVFIAADLTHETLSPDCDIKRQKFAHNLEELCNKIRSCHPSVRPRMNTPSQTTNQGFKLPPAPPSEIPEVTAEEEMYTEFDPSGGGDAEPENYLEFEPSQTSGDLSQEVYEAMNPEDDEVYEEPSQDGPSDVYEEPVSTTSSGGRPSTSTSLHVPTPSQSRENSASGAEFIEPTRQRMQLEEPSAIGDMSMDWGNIYSPIKGEKIKVATLKGVSIKGPLEKLGGRKQKTWQRRYCVMAGPLMYFYEKESSKTYNNHIVIPNFTVALAPNMTDEKKKQFAFRLSQLDSATGKNKDYYFRANSAETRNKWVSAIQQTAQSSPPPSRISATLPRMLSGGSLPAVVPPVEKHRSMSVGDDGQELYEDMPERIPEESIEEEEDTGDYLPVSPVHEGTDEHNVEELTSSAEYVDVKPNTDDIEEENYEDTTNFQMDLPPPPLSPPPGPPTSHPPVFSPPPGPPIVHHPPPKLPPHDSNSYSSKKPAPPPPVETTVDIDKVYTQGSNGIKLKNVYVVVWNFEAHEKDELNLNRGDLVLVSNNSADADWWYGELLDNEAENRLGRSGLFPRGYADLAFEPVNS